MSTPHSLLKQYWGYDDFRPFQEDIINAYWEGDDVFAVLPTGGGKSLCFQIPGLLKPHLTIVVSPLIALIEDQVQDLKGRGIKAEYIHGGLRKREIDVILDNCQHGDVKFLYVSPERLQSTFFKERIKHIQVSALVIDEAHCISQWGNDFRPAYLSIIEIQKTIPQTPIMALTASATNQVKEEIISTLKLAVPKLFYYSSKKKNLVLQNKLVDDKNNALLQALKSHKGSSIVYCSTRKSVQEVEYFLNKNAIPALGYHAGKLPSERKKIQNQWATNHSRVMVATNAFGMGINKKDVRSVIHYSAPNSIEAYYQEAGRAGRDGNTAHATLLYTQKDLDLLLEKSERKFPSLDFIKQVYQSLANFYQLAIGSFTQNSLNFVLLDFCHKYNLPTLETYNALKLLEKLGFIQLGDAVKEAPKIRFLLSAMEMYKFQVKYANYDVVIKTILRLCGASIYDHYAHISPKRIGLQIHQNEHEINSTLFQLNKLKVVDYIVPSNKPQLLFLRPRQDVNKMKLNVTLYNTLKEGERNRIEAIIRYASLEEQCLQQFIGEYFGEKDVKRCGNCKNCMKEMYDEEELESLIKKELSDSILSIEELCINLSNYPEDLIKSIVRSLFQQSIISLTDDKRLRVEK